MLPQRRMYRPEINATVHSDRRQCSAISTALDLGDRPPVLNYRDNSQRSSLLQVFAKLSVLLQQRLRTPEQLEQALHLLLHLKRLSKSSQQCSACYSVLVDILRGSSAQHGEAAVQTTLEVIAVTLKHDTSSCGPFVDLGVVT